MLHDAKCELRGRPAWERGECHCGSRANPLCVGCRDARHQAHSPNTPAGVPCVCDLCAVAA